MKEKLIEALKQIHPDYIWHIGEFYSGCGVPIMDKKGISYIRLWIDADVFDAPLFYITDLSIHKEYRKMGHATRLMNMAENIAYISGHDKINLFVYDKSWLYEWYKRLGYKEIDDGNIIQMVKNIEI